MRTLDKLARIGEYVIAEDGKKIGDLVMGMNGKEWRVYFTGGFAYYRPTLQEAKRVAMGAPTGAVSPKAAPVYTRKPVALHRPPRLYFAYGANMNVEGMKYRCPTATLVGPCVLKGWKLAFRGCADIVESPNDQVTGVMWLIEDDDEHALDHFEGYPISYIKKRVTVTPDKSWGEEPVRAMVYIMMPNRWRGFHGPSKGYYECIAEGYRAFGMDEEPLERAAMEADLKDHYGKKEEVCQLKMFTHS
jgi:hypothetical protein